MEQYFTLEWAKKMRPVYRANIAVYSGREDAWAKNEVRVNTFMLSKAEALLDASVPPLLRVLTRTSGRG